MAEDIEVKSFLIAKMNNERYKAMKEQGTLPANSIIFTPGVGGGMASMPMGTIFASAIPISNPKVHLLDGSTILQEGIYSQFAEHIKSLVATGHNISCTQSEFDTSVSTYGQCGKFVIDNTVGTIRLPLITEFIASNNGGQEIGLAQLDTLKSHTHEYLSAYGGSVTNVYGSYPGSKAQTGATGDGETKPKNIRYPYYIVLATGYKSTGDIELDNLLNEINSKPTLDEVYPIGSIYITANDHQNPAKIFGGTWERIEDKFLLGAGGSYAGGAEGGEVNHQLTVAEMPQHNHAYRASTSTYWSGVPHCITQSAGSGNADGSLIQSLDVWWSGVMPKGGSGAHNNMPPYLAVYIYQRVE